MMKKILLSVAIIGAVAAIVIGATTAYFSDTETSQGNTFTAGTLDLEVDIDGVVYNPLDKTIFNVVDIKPGDDGEETISLHVQNDACGFVTFALAEDKDNTCTEPELEVETNCKTDTDGELNDSMIWKIWNDEGDILGWQCKMSAPCRDDEVEGDNILNGKYEHVLVSGPLVEKVQYAFGMMKASNVLYYGFAWELPAGVGNEAQSDSFKADMTIKAEQYRNQYDDPQKYPNGCPIGEIGPS